MRVKCSAVFKKNRSRHCSAGWVGMCPFSAGLIPSRNCSDRSGYCAMMSIAVKLTNVYWDKAFCPIDAVIKLRFRRI